MTDTNSSVTLFSGRSACKFPSLGKNVPFLKLIAIPKMVISVSAEIVLLTLIIASSFSILAKLVLANFPMQEGVDNPVFFKYCKYIFWSQSSIYTVDRPIWP